MVASTLHVNSFEPYVIFDPSSTHSYMSSYFAFHFSGQPMILDHPFWVSTPMGKSLMVQLIFPPCIVSVIGMDTLANLLLLEVFDVILGMDRLASCYTIVDYYSKAVKFYVEIGSSFVF